MKRQIERFCSAQRPLSAESGFTLVEMLIVVALIGMIAAFVGSNLISRYNRAKVDGTKVQMRQLGTVLDQFRLDCGFYPTSEQGLEALIRKPGGRECKNYDPAGYLKDKRAPEDGFGTAFVYESDGSNYVLKSYGNDQKPGGDGVDADLTYPEGAGESGDQG